MVLEMVAFGYGLIEGPRVDAAGHLYFSDVPNGGVYRRSPDGTIRSDPFSAGARVPGELWRIEQEGEATLLYDQVGLSNGIGFSPDGRLLYHADSAARAIIVHDVAEDGSLHHRRGFPMQVDGVPDGLAVDEAGCIWVAAARGGCAARYQPDGTLERTLPVPA